MPKTARYIVFGEEVGDAGTPHLQGYVQFTRAKRLNFLRKLHPRAIWGPAIKSPAANIEHCRKQGLVIHEKGEAFYPGSRADVKQIYKCMKLGVYDDHLIERFSAVYAQHRSSLMKTLMQSADTQVANLMYEKYKDMTLRTWQHDVLLKLTEQDSRKILFIVDSAGNQGKTDLADYLRATTNAFVTSSTKYANVTCGYRSKIPRRTTVIFDLVRQHHEFIQYGSQRHSRTAELFAASTKVLTAGCLTAAYSF